ncbi:MAG TPA: response regulator [Candidatus Sulfomarinibacteraceae bacterium]|nr:response regulator [Candidatus Sulfomarinibacteraceae bacterium]
MSIPSTVFSRSLARSDHITMKNTATILLVEDDPSILDGMADLLQISDIGYEINVLKATNGEEGLLRMEDHDPDLIISDIMMPRLNGFEFLARVRENPSWVHIPFIFLTAKGKKQDIMEGRRSGAELYITKPFVSAELLELVKSQLDRTFQLQQARQQKLGALKRNILQLLNHEFRTPLTYVTAYYDMLADSLLSVEDSNNLQEYLRGIQVGCVRLTNLVQDLVRVMDIRTGRAVEKFKQQARLLNDVGALLRQRGEAHAARARQAGVTIEYDIAADLAPVYADPASLADAIDRLIDNAIKFTAGRREGPQRVRLSAEMHNEQVVLSVEDTGVGFPAHVQRQLFDLFFQYNRERLEQQGSGSGLAIAKGLVALHHGHIEVESKENSGSRFSIVLPPYDQAINLDTKSAQPTRQATILIVEDDRHLLEGLRELMKMADMPYQLRVLTATNGEEGLAVLDQYQADLIISDVMMPTMGGYEFLQRVRSSAAWLQIPFIFLTAKGEREDIHRGRRSGAEEYITKPYDIDELIQLTVTQLDRYFQRQGAMTQSFEALKRSILGMLQPDFRGPLDLVTTYSEKLSTDLEQVETDEDLAASLEGIQDSSARLTRLVEDFIAMAEFKTGEAESAFHMRARPVENISMVLYEAAYGVQFDAEQKGIEFRYDLNHDLPSVVCDRERLLNALERLLTFVLENCETEDSTIIRVASNGAEKHVDLQIQAFNTRFPTDWARRIAQFFAREDETMLDLPGAGPGLTVIKNTVALHGGQIRLQQHRDDQITIRLLFPVHRPQSVKQNAHAS